VIPAVLRISCCTLILVSAQAWAEPAAPHGEASVEVSVSGTDNRVEGARGTIEEVLAPMEVHLAVLHIAPFEPQDVIDEAVRPDSQALARIWIDLCSETLAAVYLVDSARGRVLVRQIELEGGVLDVVALEEIRQIVGASVEALLSGHAVGVPTEDAAESLGLASQAEDSEPEDPRDAPPPEPDQPEPTEPRQDRNEAIDLEVGVAYGFDIWSGEAAPLSGPSAWMGLVLPTLTLRPAVGLGLGYRLPAEVLGQGAGVRLDHFGLSLLLSVEVLSRGLVSLRVGLGPALALVRVEPVQAPPDVGMILGDSRLEASLALRAAAELRVRIAGPVSFFACLTVDTQISRVTYVIDRGDAEETLIAPWPVWAGLGFGLTVEVG